MAEEVRIVEVDSLAFVSRWVTPARFRADTTPVFIWLLQRVAALDAGSRGSRGRAYINPVTALTAHQAQEWPMALPTLAHLRWLAKFATIQEAVEATKGAKPDPVAPVVLEG